MTSGKVSDALLDWHARLATLSEDQRTAATATLLKLLRARAAVEGVLESNTHFSRENETSPAGGTYDD